MPSNELFFTDHKIFEIFTELSAKIEQLKSGDVIEFTTMSPDLNNQLFNGEMAEYQGQKYLQHSLKCWIDLAEVLNCRMLLPQILSDGKIKISLQLLNHDGWHQQIIDDQTEKYGIYTNFFRIDKSEEAAFYYDFTASLANFEFKQDCKVLNLGCHRGTEFSLLHNFLPEIFQCRNFTGLDHSKTAIEQARKDFPDSNLVVGDINNLTDLIYGHFDLIISIGTLQSPGINAKKIFMQLVQDYLAPDGVVLIGQPNCRYLESEMKYGAVTKNRKDGELGLAINDLSFYKKYLQQHKFETYLRGKYYLFLSGQNKN